jgi:two-component system, LytTR family, sensor kinase
MNFKNIQIKGYYLHLFVWIFYVIYTLLNIQISYPDFPLYVDDWGIYFAGLIYLFYSVPKIIDIIVVKRQILFGILVFILCIILFYLIEYSRALYAEFMGRNNTIPNYYFNVGSFLIVYANEWLQFGGFAIVYWFYNYNIKQQKEKLALEQRNHEIEVSFLKSQINQHFVYNMLNMFYSNAMKYSDTLAEGILSLSELMRFSVSHEQNSLIAVSEEIKYVESYIHLNQLRFEEKLLINFKTGGDLSTYKIPHLCILTLVENAFKHGNLKTKPLDISIIANTEELKVSLKNQKRTSKIEDSTGIGLENLERRLSLLLENRFLLETHQDQNFFYTELVIRPAS